MPLTPLNQALQTTGSAFDQKLDTLTGFAQSVKQSQVRKQQMAENLEQQKEMIRYRAGVQLQQQMTMQGVKQQQQQQRDYRENIQESLQNAQESIKDYVEKESERQNITRYNLGNFEYRPEAIEKDGQVAGYQPAIYYNAGEGERIQMDYDRYIKSLDQLEEFGSFLKGLQEKDLGVSKQQVEEIGGQRVNVEYIGEDNKENYISQIKTDPEFRAKEFNKWRQNLVRDADQVAMEGEGGGGKSTPQTESLPLVGQLKQALGDSSTKTYTFNEDVSNFFGGDVATASTIDFTSSISGVKEQINKTIRQGLLPENSQFNLGQIPREVRQQVVAGNVSDEALSAIPENMRDDVETVASFSGESRQKLKELLNYYNYYDGFYNEYSKVARQAKPQDEIFLDLWNAPEDLRSLDSYIELAKPISQVNERQKLLQFGQNLRRESDVTAQWLGGYGNIGTE